MKKTTSNLFILPYFLWIFLFVLAPVVMIIFQSFFNVEGKFSLENYKEFFTSQNLTYLKMSFNSVLYAGIVTLVTLLISYPTAYFFDAAQTPAVVVDVDRLANLGQSLAQGLCLYRNLWSKRLHQ